MDLHGRSEWTSGRDPYDRAAPSGGERSCAARSGTPSVEPARIGVLGTSRGGELALLLAATYPSLFRVAVAYVPSNVVWPGLSDDSETPAWTLKGAPLPSVPSDFTAADLALSSRDRFLKRMQDPAALAHAEIQVERIGGPVLMFSAKDDQNWPSDVFAARVAERLKAHHFKHPVEHYSYEDAGHSMGRPFLPTSNVRQVSIHPVSKRPMMSGELLKVRRAPMSIRGRNC